MRKIWIIHRSIGNSYTTFKSPYGEECRVFLKREKIGPFENIPEATDWLSKNAMIHSSYELEEEIKP